MSQVVKIHPLRARTEPRGQERCAGICLTSRAIRDQGGAETWDNATL